MEGTLWNVHHGTYPLDLTLWKLPSVSYTMEGTAKNLHHGSYVV